MINGTNVFGLCNIRGLGGGDCSSSKSDFSRSINVIFRVPDEELLLNGHPLLVGNIPYKRNVGHLGGW